MSHVVKIIVPPGKKKERLDVYITGHVENATRNKVQQAIRGGTVLVNGGQVRPSYTVMPDDVIYITLPRPPPSEALPEDIPLEILFEDSDLVVVNKPAGMVTHPAYGNYTGTLVNALLHHCGTLGAGGDPIRPGIVHRLDKNTSGVMVAAKNDTAHAKLAKQFAARTIRREYQAIVWGRFGESSGLIEAGLGRSKSDRKKMAVVDGGKSAATEYTVLEQFPYLALLRLKLRTGRTHQIRVHLAHINHPVFGDPTYNGRRIVWGSGGGGQKSQVQQLLALMPRQALHAKTIGFVHPTTRNQLFFETDLPTDMRGLLDSLRHSNATVGDPRAR
jgi:23S rRNA pseudouridine1911/1915/1917 synthase